MLYEGKSQQVFIKNTVNVANKLLDSIERDIADSKVALLAKEKYYILESKAFFKTDAFLGVPKIQKQKIQCSIVG